MCITEQVSTNLKEFNFIQKNSMMLMELVWGRGKRNVHSLGKQLFCCFDFVVLRIEPRALWMKGSAIPN